MRKICNYWAIVYILAVTLLLPLYIENKYFNITEAKRHAFFWIAVILIPIGIAFFAVAAKKSRISFGRFDLMDYMIIGIAFISMISSLLSDDIYLSMFGINGWGVGAFVWICLALSYLLVSRFFIYSQNIWLPVIIINACILMITVIQAAGGDPFGLHKGISPDQLYSYYGTIGNTNWWTGYLCLFVPLIIVFFSESKTVISRIIYLVFWGLLCFAILICSVDGVYVGFGVCAFFAIPYLLKNNDRIEKTGWLISVFGVVILLYTLIPVFSGRIENISGITKIISRPVIGLIICVVGCLWIVLSRLLKNKLSDNVCLILTIFFEWVLGCVALLFLINTILTYDDHWGTLRGKIWIDSFTIFRQFPLKNKLIGVGPEMLRPLYIWLSDWLGRTLLVSHSEPIQYLLTMGISGMIAWAGIWVSTAIYVLRDPERRENKTAFFLAAMAYFGQSLINSATIINIAILFIVLAFIRIPDNKEEHIV